jgi:hypothetical protein
MRLPVKSREVFAVETKTNTFRDPLHDESGKPFEIDDASAIQSGRRGVAVSNGTPINFSSGLAKSWKFVCSP